MIEVVYERRKDLFKLISKGHANYGSDTADIVCAAVSAVLGGLEGFIRLEDGEKNFQIRKGHGYYSFFGEGSEKIRHAFEFAVLTVKMIENTYPMCVKLEITGGKM